MAYLVLVLGWARRRGSLRRVAKGQSKAGASCRKSCAKARRRAPGTQAPAPCPAAPVRRCMSGCTGQRRDLETLRLNLATGPAGACPQARIGA
ncbi:hypothetical protein C4K39_2494 [Pseudomonas sessilinigenes]|nr:hypothetical protein C4K39_2494 [Pseudomonas sessilinigenes]